MLSLTYKDCNAVCLGGKAYSALLISYQPWTIHYYCVYSMNLERVNAYEDRFYQISANSAVDAVERFLRLCSIPPQWVVLITDVTDASGASVAREYP
jgi:hypothetical protein